MVAVYPKTNEEMKAEIFGDYYYENPKKKILIKDIPFGISDQGELICIPAGSENFRVAVVGASGSGKTFLLHRIVDCCFYYSNMSMAIVNDYQIETYSWIYKNTDFERELKKYNELPYPLPLVQVYLHHKDNEILVPEGAVPAVRMSIPFSEILKNLHIFLNISPKDSAFKYIRKIIPKLQECESPEEVKEVIEKIGFQEEIVGLDSMKFSIQAKFDDILQEGFIDIVANQKMYKNSGTPSSFLRTKYHSSKSKKERDFIAPVFSFLMRLGLVPVLMTYDFVYKYYAPTIVSYVLNEIFEYPRKYGKNCVVIFPEISTFSSTEQKGLADESLKNIAARGRYKGVYLICDTQFYDRISSDIKKNMAYIFAFNQKEETAKDIVKDFGLGSQEKKWIINLKTHQFLAICSTSNKFAVYDYYGNRKELPGPFRCMSLPPLSLHSKPYKK